MTHKIFHSAMLSRGQPEPANLAVDDFATKELALEAAFALIEQKQIVWRIEGPDGFKIGRRDLDVLYNDKTGIWPSR
jgi:hypothetical protein